MRSSPAQRPPDDRPGGRRRWVVLGVIGLVVVLLLLVAGGWVAFRLLVPPSDTGGGKASKPLRIVPVADSTPRGCPSGGPGASAVDGRTCYRLGQGGMKVLRLEVAEAEPDPSGGGWHISARLNDDDARRFARLTKQHLNDRLALVSDGRVIAAPTVQQPISGAELQITGNFTGDQAKKIAGNLPA